MGLHRHGADMTDQADTQDLPERLDLRSHDIAADRRQELLRLFPEVRTEDGKLDFERLQLALGEAVDAGKERYGLSWPGKADCFKAIQAPSVGTLRPCPEESVNFDATENLILEGDNLEVLKLLQKAYLGRVKMIYIDPPYNTGNDFIYPDDYTESLQTYLEYTGQVDAERRKFSTNTDADGRFHSKWLTMMYPRLYLARNLLSDNGLIFVSIDDNELSRLLYLCDEIFGEDNRVATVVWKKSYGGGAKTKHVIGLHEYIVAYSRNKDAVGSLELPPNPEVLKYYKFRDDKYETRGPYRTQPLATTSMDERPNLRFPIAWEGEEIWPEKQWQWSPDRVQRALAEGELIFKKRSGKWVVDYKQYLRNEAGEERGSKPFSVLDGPYTQAGTAELRDLALEASGFTFPKPVGLIRELLLYCAKDALVLDFFAGSGTTAQAVLTLNSEDGGSRRFILVQLPEPTNRVEYPTICYITRARARAVIARLDEQEASTSRELFEGDSPAQDRGFRSYKLAESNFRPWDAEVSHDAEALGEQLELHVEHIREGRTAEDLLYEILLKSGFPLTAPVDSLTLAGKTVHSVAGGALFVCLERELTLELIRAMAERKPERVVCLDAGFAGNDQLKANAVQTFKTKGVTSFKTV
jgi:adenine-specific DNA-methyltransferase